MLKRKRGETVQVNEWDGQKAEVTVWKQTATGNVQIEIQSPDPLTDEHVDGALRLARRIVADLTEEE